MSKLLHVKGIILTHMTADPRLRDAVMEVVNSIDADLDQVNYDEDMCSDRTLESIENLDRVLTLEDEVEVEEELSAVSRTSPLDLNDADQDE